MIYLLAGLLVASWATQLIRERQVAAERRKLLNAALATTPGELVALERVDQAMRRKRRKPDDDEETGTGRLVGLA